MKYALTMGERFAIVEISPREGDILTMQDVADIRKSVWPTTAERAEYKIVPTEEGGIRWSDDMADATAEIDFTAPEVALITNALRKLNEDKKLKLEHLSLYEKFVEAK